VHEDARGALDWAPPDDDVFVFITGIMGSAGTYLYGRRMYETMAVWETDATLATRSELTRTYATTWQRAEKVVYSSTLTEPLTATTEAGVLGQLTDDLHQQGPHRRSPRPDTTAIDRTWSAWTPSRPTSPLST
jgi:hypothetical protein